MKITPIIVILAFLAACSEYGSTQYNEGKYKEISIEDNYPDLIIKITELDKNDNSANYASLKKEGEKILTITKYKSGERSEELRFYYNLCGYLLMVSSINHEANEFSVMVTESSGGDKYFISPMPLLNLDANRIFNERLSECRK